MTDIIERAIYLRGLFLQRYAGVEFALAHLIAVAKLHAAYQAFPVMSASHSKRVSQLNRLVKAPGPLMLYAKDLFPAYERMKAYYEDRMMMAHAIMGSGRGHALDCGVSFRMYQKRAEEIFMGSLDLTISEFEQLVEQLVPFSTDLTALVAKVCRTMGTDIQA